jgi:hypothetical protein
MGAAAIDRARFEVLPFAGIEAEAARLPRPMRPAVMCSPAHGPDRGVEVATRLCGSGHSVTSARIGVGPSVEFLRKQRGLRRLLSRRSTLDRLYAELGRLDVAGCQFFTFNELVDTWEWWENKGKESGHVGTEPAGASGRLGRHGRAAA